MPTRDVGRSEDDEVVDVRYIKLRPGEANEFLKDLRKAHDKMIREEKGEDKKRSAWDKLTGRG